MPRLCTLDEIPEGLGRPFEVACADGTSVRVLVVRQAGEVYAYENRCSHFGVRLDVTPDYRFVEDGLIVCQVHYARYDLRSGACVRGECGVEGLRSLPVAVRDGAVHLLR